MPSAAAKFWSPLGLPRLRAEVLPGDAPPLASGQYQVDMLEPSPGATAPGLAVRERDGLRVLEVRSDTEWSRPLLEAPQDSLFVSLGLYMARKTIVTLGGTMLCVSDGPISGYATLYRLERGSPGSKWVTTGVQTRWEHFDGKMMAVLPAITVRLDRNSGNWDLYNGPRLVSANLPRSVASGSSDWRITVESGESESWITGLIQTPENPLFADENANTIDDAAEKEALGGRLLAADSSVADRQSVSRQRREHRPRPALLVERLKPDRLRAPSPTTRTTNTGNAQ
ncbi:MAG: hypothetical protein ACREIA_00945 [Opitutaceae bacterium]